MTTVCPYPEYKALGVNWLSGIPSHWSANRLKRLARLRYGLGQPPREKPDGIPVIRATNIERGRIQSVNMLRADPDDVPESRGQLLRADDILVVRSGAYTSDSARVGESFAGSLPGYDMVVSPTRVESRFLAWALLSSYILQDQLRLLQSRAAQPHLNTEELGSVTVLHPGLEEQRSIADFLDAMDERVNRFIDARRRMIALLEQQKQAIINQAVTKGLVPDVPMKPSGIDWLGDIPAHWEVRRFKSLIRSLDQGVSPLTDAGLAENGAWGVVKSGCVNGGVFRQTEHKKLPDGFVFDPSLAISVGDVLVSRASGSRKFVGATGKVRQLDYQLILSDKTFRPVFSGSFDSEFAVYAMNSWYFRDSVEQAISGAEGLANNLPSSSLKEFPIVVPPLDEQLGTVKQLNHDVFTVGETVSRYGREIQLIQEYRTRLISDVVTGKLDVRKVEGPSETSELPSRGL